MSPEQEALLRKLAEGELDEQTRASLVSLLAGNEVAMEFLVTAATG